MDKEKLEKNIWKFHFLNILRGLFFAMPILILFRQENGLSFREIMLIQSVFGILVILLEVPSGYFSDIFGRKKTLIIFSIAWFLGNLMNAFGHNFWEFLGAEIFFAIAVSFQSGTLSAFLFETLKGLDREKDYKKIFGQSVFYGMIATAVASILGGFVAEYNLRYAVMISLPFFFMIIPIVFTFYEPKKIKKIEKDNYIKEIFLTIKNEVWVNEKLKWLIIYSAIIFAFNTSIFWLSQPYFELAKIDLMYFGIIFASFSVVGAFASKYAHKIEERLGEKNSLFMLMILLSGSLLLMHSFVSLFSFSFIFILHFVRGFKKVVISDYINKMIKDSDLRATILSVESLVSRLIYAIAMPLVGWLADVYSLLNALLIIAVMVLVLGSVALWKMRKI